MTRLLHEGGPTMFWILGLVMPGLAFSILHIVLARGWTRWLTLGVMAVVLAIGLYGRAMGRLLTDDALEHFEGADHDALRAKGYEEASRPLQLAGVVDGVLAIGLVAGELRRRKRRRRG